MYPVFNQLRGLWDFPFLPEPSDSEQTWLRTTKWIQDNLYYFPGRDGEISLINTSWYITV